MVDKLHPADQVNMVDKLHADDHVHIFRSVHPSTFDASGSHRSMLQHPIRNPRSDADRNVPSLFLFGAQTNLINRMKLSSRIHQKSRNLINLAKCCGRSSKKSIVLQLLPALAIA